MMQKNKKLNIVKFFNTRKVYTRDKNVIGKSGVYEDVEWSKTRKIGNTFYSNPSSKNYYEMIFSDISKISAANTLSMEFDFSKFNKIGDIGGVPFSQVWTIKKIYPHLKFYLTDYDGGSISKHKECPIFESDDFFFEEFNVVFDDLGKFDDCDLLTMWGVDYALDDDCLKKIFKYLIENNKKVLIASIDIDNDGIFKNFIRGIINYFENLIGKARYHGVLRNQEYFKNICNSVGIKLKLVCVANNYRIYLINS